jgi:hypothetical protein
MYQPWLFAATIAGGSGLFAYAAVQHGVAPPDIAPAPESVNVVPFAVPVPEPVVEPASTVMEIEPIVIEAKRHVRAKAVVPKPSVEASRPCSNWREIGPSHVSQGNPSGAVSVRELCP